MREIIGAVAVITSLLVASPVSAATTYDYIGPPYTLLHNHTTCTLGTCNDYATSMRVTGSFTVSVPLAPNLANVDISTSANLLAWTFFDGVNTISNTTPNAYIFPGFFFVSTDTVGNVTSTTDIVVGNFTTSVGTGMNIRVNSIGVGDDAPGDYGLNNDWCMTMNGSACSNEMQDTNSSSGVNFTAGAWSTAAPPPPGFVSAASRKVHGVAGTFNLPLSAVITNPTTEPRQGPSQTIVFTFDKPIASVVVTVTAGTATAGAPTFSGNDVIVALAGVNNQQYVTVALTSVAATDGGTGGNASVRIGFLVGDVNQNRVVTLADLGFVNAQLAQAVTAANFLKDVNASGTLTLTDKLITNANLTKALPAP